MKINIDLFGSDSDVLSLSSLSQQIMSLLLIMINEKADERTMRENNDKSNLSLIIQFFLFSHYYKHNFLCHGNTSKLQFFI